MTDITIHDFARRAGLDPDAAIRTAKEDATRLNRGTLGDRFVSWLRDVGEGLGFQDPSRAERQTQALAGFRTALTAHFGAEIGGAVLREAGLDGNVAVLTGAQANAAIDRARELWAGRLSDHHEETASRLPGGGSFNDVQREALGENAGPLTDAEQAAYAARLQARVATLDLRVAGSKDKIAALAVAAMQEVRALSNAGKLEAVEAARADAVARLRELAGGVAGRMAPQDLARRLARAGEALDALSALEPDGEARAPERLKELLAEVIAGEGETRETLRAVQEGALGDFSALRALRADIAGQLRGDTITQRQRRDLERLTDIADALVDSVGRRIGALGRDVEADSLNLSNEQRVGANERDLARRGIERRLDRHAISPVPPGRFLAALHDGRLPQQGAPLLASLEEHVHAQMREDAVSLADAVANFRKAFKEDQALAPGVRARLERALDGLAAERRLADKLGLPEKAAPQAWRLVLRGAPGDKWMEEGRWPGLAHWLTPRLRPDERPPGVMLPLGNATEADQRQQIAKRALNALREKSSPRVLLQLQEDLHAAGLPPALLPPDLKLKKLDQEKIRAGQTAWAWAMRDPSLAERDFAACWVEAMTRNSAPTLDDLGRLAKPPGQLQLDRGDSRTVIDLHDHRLDPGELGADVEQWHAGDEPFRCWSLDLEREGGAPRSVVLYADRRHPERVTLLEDGQESAIAWDELQGHLAARYGDATGLTLHRGHVASYPLGDDGDRLR
jgi:hypothetical protein